MENYIIKAIAFREENSKEIELKNSSFDEAKRLYMSKIREYHEHEQIKKCSLMKKDEYNVYTLLMLFTYEI